MSEHSNDFQRFSKIVGMPHESFQTLAFHKFPKTVEDFQSLLKIVKDFNLEEDWKMFQSYTNKINISTV